MAQLQAEVSFSDVQAQPNYQKLPSDVQAQIALDYFDKRVATQQGFQSAPPDAQQAIKQDFMRKYNVPDIQVAPSPAPPPKVPAPVMMGVAPGIGAYQAPSMGDLEKYNQGYHSGLSAVVKGATLGYADPYNPKLNNPQAEQIRAIPDFVGQLIPYEIANTLMPGSGATLLGRVAKGAGAFGTVGALQSQPENQFDLLKRLESAGEGAMTGAAWELGLAGLGKALGGVSRFLHPEAPPARPRMGRAEITVQKPAMEAKVSPAGVEYQSANVSAQKRLAGQQTARKAQNQRAAADLHDLLTSQDATKRMQGQALYTQLREAAKDKKYRSGRVKEAGSQQAREILAEHAILKEKARGTSTTPKKGMPDQKSMALIVKTGRELRQQGGEAKAKFDNYLDRTYDKETKRIINARIGKEIETGKAGNKALSDKVKERTKKRQAQKEETRKALAKKAQDEKRASIKAENDRIAAELKKQAEETKVKKKASSAPKVLTPAEIEAQAEQLFQHHQKGEKGTLDAKISKIKSASKADFTKSGLEKSRSDAINETHARVLDRYNQKKAELESVKEAKKPQNVVKARAENLKELEDTKKAGGSYDFNTGKGRQKDLKPSQLPWSEVRDSITDPEVQAWGDIIDEAMRTDGKVRIRYDAERTGDTGQFEHKEVSPIDWGFNFTYDAAGNPTGTKAVFHAVNKYGHTGEYYLEPSAANPKTGTISAVLEAPVKVRGEAFRGTDPNVYKGPREFKLGDIMSRPPRRNMGLTSETQAKLAEAKDILSRYEAGETMSAKDINKAARNVKKAQTEQQNGAKQQAKEGNASAKQKPAPEKGETVKRAAKSLKNAASRSKAVRASLESETVTAQDLKNMSKDFREGPGQKDVNEVTDC